MIQMFVSVISAGSITKLNYSIYTEQKYKCNVQQFQDFTELQFI